MTVQELIAQLQLLPADAEVMFAGPNSDESLYSVNTANFRVAEEDEFDEDWDMPEGFQFVELLT